MDYRHDLLRWRRAETGETFQELADRSGVSSTTICDAFRGVLDPRASTIKAIFKATGLDPKFALDFSLRKSEFRRAVVETGR
jgi:predicted transcriptional regulator